MENWKSNIAIALIAAASASLGSCITGNYLIESNKQQIESQHNQYRLDQKSKYIDNLIKLSSEYGVELEALVNTALTDSNNDKQLIAHISVVQRKGTELMLVTNDEIAQIVNSVNYQAVLYLKNKNTDESQIMLNKLGTINVALMKSLRELIQASFEFQLNSPNKLIKPTPGGAAH